ncbi:hypothetical protein V5799_023018 [Amblyomma americanum]|uniref:Amino acid transporter n=1 Tax=Amblyomma americanum TaxID=6943 RepID=A0AAQ4FIR2_AMBAM
MGDMICSLYAWCFLLAEPMGTTLHALTFTSYCLSVVYGSFTPPYVVTILVTVAVIAPFPFDRFSFKSDTTPGRALQALSVAMFTGAGSTPICCMAEEMSNPGRIIPRSLLGGLFLVISLHVLTNMAYFIVLDPQRLTSSEATAFTFARPTWGVAGEVLVPVIVCICTFGTMSAACLTGSRLLLATARNKHLPEMLSLITTSSSLPVVAIICRTCLAILFTLTGSVEFLAKGFVGVISFMNVLTMFAMLKWRGHVQDTSRTFRVPTVLIFINIGILSLLTVIPLLGGREVTEYLVTLCFCLLGMPAFGVFRALGRTNAAVFAFTCLQKLFLSVPCTPFNKIERGRS